MKKKMSIIAVLVLAVTVSIYSVAGTYAKYVSTKEVSDKARVAKWLTLGDAVTLNLFDESYGTSPNESVKSSETGVKVIAPGTEKKATLAVNITQAPEVAYKVTLVDNGSNLEGTLASKIKFSADNGTTWGTLTEALNTINNAATTHNPGESDTINITLKWKWDFEVSDDENTSDTTLGEAGSAKAEVKLKVVAEQVQ